MENTNSLPEELGGGGKSATPIEARAAIEALSEDEHVKLMKIAEYYVYTRIHDGSEEAADLLHTAIMKTLAGSRTWNKRVSMVTHLAGVIESESSHIARDRAAHPMVHAENEDDLPFSKESSPERRIEVEEKVGDAIASFGEDGEAKRYLELRAEGLLGEELRQALGLGETEYETLAKRVRRGIAKYMAGGGR